MADMIRCGLRKAHEASNVTVYRPSEKDPEILDFLKHIREHGSGDSRLRAAMGPYGFGIAATVLDHLIERLEDEL